MQSILIDKPYHFVPPRPNALCLKLIQAWLPRYLRRAHGIESWELLGTERLRASLDAGHGVMLAPNHCRPCDPMVVGLVGRAVGRSCCIMASWHLFMQSRFQAWLLPRLGVFSLYREGMDREALKCAVRILTEAQRPLVVFPEGAVTRTNDRLNHLMEGTAFIARSAARQRADTALPGKVVVHPVAIRYFHGGDIASAVTPVIEAIEQRLTWQPRTGQPLLERIRFVGRALLTLKEIEYFGEPCQGSWTERLAALIDRVLAPLETEWLKGRHSGDVVARVKALRAAILPDLVAAEVCEAERARRWRHLADTYLAQQLFLYPPEYFGPAPTAEQVLETVERFEEDLTDSVRVYRPLHAAVAVGEAIEVSAGRERGAAGDPLMVELRQRLEAGLAELRRRSPYPTRG
jgi:1-acyl-sn-glycerol-3-phosphate acyltransferase